MKTTVFETEIGTFLVIQVCLGQYDASEGTWMDNPVCDDDCGNSDQMDFNVNCIELCYNFYVIVDKYLHFCILQTYE